jgi:hypothetical protein
VRPQVVPLKLAAHVAPAWLPVRAHDSFFWGNFMGMGQQWVGEEAAGWKAWGMKCRCRGGGAGRRWGSGGEAAGRDLWGHCWGGDREGGGGTGARTAGEGASGDDGWWRGEWMRSSADVAC